MRAWQIALYRRCFEHILQSTILDYLEAVGEG